MKLHNNNEEFRAAISEAAMSLSLAEYVVEKDYWITKLLHNLFNYKYKQFVIFKGGTALSKGYKLINRFSEDVDLALHPDGMGEKKIHKREGQALHNVTKSLKDDTFTDEKAGKESEGKRYKRVYTFPQNFDYPKDSPIHGKIVLEVNSFSIPIPTELVTIRSLVSEYLENKYGGHILEELDLVPFEIEALVPERTFCEKLLALRRAGHRGDQFLKERIRHVYDIHQLYNSSRIKNWMNNRGHFFEMLNRCYQDDELNQKISKERSNDFKSFDIFSDSKNVIISIKGAYEGLRNITFDNQIPSIEEVSESLQDINNILRSLKFEED